VGRPAERDRVPARRRVTLESCCPAIDAIPRFG
jgi:hypothetical protein